MRVAVTFRTVKMQAILKLAKIVAMVSLFVKNVFKENRDYG